MVKPFPARWRDGNWARWTDAGGYFIGSRAPAIETISLSDKTFDDVCVLDEVPHQPSGDDAGAWTSLAPMKIKPLLDPEWLQVDFGESSAVRLLRALGIKRTHWNGLTEAQRETMKGYLRVATTMGSALQEVAEAPATQAGAKAYLEALAAKHEADGNNQGGFVQTRAREEARDIALTVWPLLTEAIIALKDGKPEGSSMAAKLREWLSFRGVAADWVSDVAIEKAVTDFDARTAAAHILARVFADTVSISFLLERREHEL